MTKQQIFNTVVAHLRKQGCKSSSPDGVCAYRMPDGRTCAIGCLIPVEEYLPTYEGHGLAKMLSGEMTLKRDEAGIPNPTYAYIRRKFGEENLPLLAWLQHIHDCKPVHGWDFWLELLARQHSLIYTHPGV